MSKKNQGASAPVVAEAPAGTAAPTAVAPVASAPVVASKPRTLADLQAGLAASPATVTGPFADDGSVENSRSMQRLLTENPTDKDLFIRDANGKLAVYGLPGEKKDCVLRKSAGPSGAVIVVRTSDIHQKRFADGEKPRGSKRSARTMTPTVVDLSAVS